jgi:hypothetical protein
MIVRGVTGGPFPAALRRARMLNELIYVSIALVGAALVVFGAAPQTERRGAVKRFTSHVEQDPSGRLHATRS